MRRLSEMQTSFVSRFASRDRTHGSFAGFYGYPFFLASGARCEKTIAAAEIPVYVRMPGLPQKVRALNKSPAAACGRKGRESDLSSCISGFLISWRPHTACAKSRCSGSDAPAPSLFGAHAWQSALPKAWRAEAPRASPDGARGGVAPPQLITKTPKGGACKPTVADGLCAACRASTDWMSVPSCAWRWFMPQMDFHPIDAVFLSY